MFQRLLNIFGNRNDRLIKQYRNTIQKINALEATYQSYSDVDLAAKIQEFKDHYKTHKNLNNILNDVFAIVREASKRSLQMRHFDVQLIGGLVLHRGNIAEMRTGEGKTLMATLAAVLNAISGNGVHVITVNDYLATRDAEWMAPIYKLLDISVGIIVANMDPTARKQAYASDVVYGTNNEFGFDYLRDNMAFSLEDQVQGKLNFAIIDEVDSILIDEARTPLIISGSSDNSSELYIKINEIIIGLLAADASEQYYTLDEKSKQVFLTEDGHTKIEQLLQDTNLLAVDTSLYSASNIMLMHYVTAALKAHLIFKSDVDYLIKDSKVVIVDEHTGRTMDGRRWSDGIHQAVEAKENVVIQNENQTLASITFQNYFRLYSNLSGMTGTADTEAYEFQHIYGLEVVVIPTNKPNARSDMGDAIYMTVAEKFDAIIEDVKNCAVRKQPVLVGTASIATSELLSQLLKKHKISHSVLNAKYHEKEAHIIAEAGAPGAITIATNMAGRGTDIVLGGSKGENLELWQQQHDLVKESGGLHIIGTERHESRRIDNQLRGRSGRQGDPGSTKFYLSVKDNLMRIFISDKIALLLNKLGMNQGEAITHSWVTKAIENAQRKVEGHNFDIRKQLLEFDNVSNEQRKIIYKQRKDLLITNDISKVIANMRTSVVTNLSNSYIPLESLEEQWQVAELEQCLAQDFGIALPLAKILDADASMDPVAIAKYILDAFNDNYAQKDQQIGTTSLQQAEKAIMLNVLDSQWKEHLAILDHLRQGIHLRGYAQQDPKQEYKREAFKLFSELLENIKYEVIRLLTVVEIRAPEEVAALEEQHQSSSNIEYHHDDSAMEANTQVRDGKKIGRNDPCYCDSGKKYKHCHGKL